MVEQLVAKRPVSRNHAAMRYDSSTRLLRLVLLLSGSHVGLTLDEMATELEVGRRTVERLRDQLAELFPGLTHREDDNRVRRWRLPKGALPPVPPTAGTLATLEALARDLAAQGDAARAADLRDAAASLRALLPEAQLRRAEPDIEALMQAEGSAAHPGPRLKLDREMMMEIRTAILGFRKLALTYRPAEPRQPGRRVICPYGVLYGRRAYLVAHTQSGGEMRLWRLDRISDVSVLGENFVPQEFDLAAYAAQSFGVFQEEPQDVVLRFSPGAADDAAEWVFHPNQTMERQDDGSLIVRFRCGGMLELSWHLFTWGGAVEVLAPAGEDVLAGFRRMEVEGSPQCRNVNIEGICMDKELLDAAESGNLAAVRRRLDDGADVNSAYCGETALCFAARGGHKDVIKYLLSRGAKISGPDIIDPMNFAICREDSEMVSLLLEAGSDQNLVDKHGTSLVSMASGYGNNEIVSELIAHKADVNIANRYGMTPLINAVVGGHSDLVATLITAGAYINHRNSYDMFTEGGATALILAAYLNKLDIAQQLVQAGADITIQDDRGRTAFSHAIAQGNRSISALLRVA